MLPKVPRLRWDEPLRALEILASLWSSTGLSSVGAGAAQAIVVPYRTLLTMLQQVLVDREVTTQVGSHQVTLTLTGLDFKLEPRALAVGQLGEIRVGARDIRWGRYRLEQATAVLSNVHIRPGIPPLIVAAPTELTSTVSAPVVEDVLRARLPWLRSRLGEDGVAQLYWARWPRWGSLEVDIETIGATSQQRTGAVVRLWPRALVLGPRRWRLPAWIPPYQIRLPELPYGLLITDVGVGLNSLRLSALLPQWQTELPLRHLEGLITQLNQGALSFIWASGGRGEQ